MAARDGATLYVTFVSANGELSPGPLRTVVNPHPILDDVVKAAMISSGATRVAIERRTSAQSTLGVITEPPLTGEAPKAEQRGVVLSFDERLTGLVRGAAVDVGSLYKMFPSYRWAADGGGSAIVLSRAYTPLSQWFAQAESGLGERRRTVASRTVRSRAATGDAVVHSVSTVPSTFTVRGVRMTRALTSANGAAVRPGDTLVDGSGVRWFAGANGVVRDARIYRLAAGDIRVLDERLVVPRARAATKPTSFGPREKALLVITWPSGEIEHVHARSFDENGTWGWEAIYSTPTVAHAMGMCLREHGVGSDYKTPAECVRHGGTWDRPCESDSECPYYDARRGRGGCRGGFCEMPMSVDRKSFRAPVQKSAPLNHGCAPGTPAYPWCPEHGDNKANARFNRIQGEE